MLSTLFSLFFFFNDTATTEIYTLSLHDALPIFERGALDDLDVERLQLRVRLELPELAERREQADRKSTRLNSSHSQISYAVFCLKKKKKNIHTLFHRNNSDFNLSVLICELTHTI